MDSLMNIKVYFKNEQIVTDSRNVAGIFNKRHDHVLRDIESLKRDVPNFGEMFFETTMPDSYWREQRVFLMNRDGFTLLAMGFTGSNAMKWKLKYMDAFNLMEKKLESPEYIMARALIMANNSIKSLKVENKALAEKIETDKPKTIFADAVATSHTSILVGDLAKLICQNGVQIGQKRLFEWLRENGYLIKSGNSKNMPTQRYLESGLFEVKESTIQNPDGSVRITKTTKITGKGQQYFVNKFLN